MDKVHGIKVVGSSFPAQIWKRVLTALLAKDARGEKVVKKESAPSPKPSPTPTIEPTMPPTEEPSPEPLPSLPPRKCTLIFCT